MRFITIIGWPKRTQVYAGSAGIPKHNREITFNATGLEMPWRTAVLVIARTFIIPIPWMLRWYGCWYVSPAASQRLACRGRGRELEAAYAGLSLRSRIGFLRQPDATSVPSCLKIRPRVRLRPPCALGGILAHRAAIRQH